MKTAEYTSLKGQALRWRADISNLHGLSGAGEKEDERQMAEGFCLQNYTFGQGRGVTAFRFGMAMRARGYNIFVTGPSLSGGAVGGFRVDTLGIVKDLLKQGLEDDKKTQVPDDICYVHNFARPDEPVLLRFAAGLGVQFKEALRHFVDSVVREIPSLFESPEYMARKNQIIESHERKSREFFKKLESRVRDAGFAVINMQMGGAQRPDIAPLIDGEPVIMMKLEELQEKGRFPQVELEVLKETYARLKDEIDAIFLEVRDVQRDVKRKIHEVDREVFQSAVRDLAGDLFGQYSDAKVRDFLEAMLRNMVEKLHILRKVAVDDANNGTPQVPAQPLMTSGMGNQENGILRAYGVNVLVDNSSLTGPPVIIESYPTYRNLFGSIERSVEQNSTQRTGQSDYRKIHAGSFIKANGGYLVLNLSDAIMEAGVWATLKRALKNESMEIQTFDPYYFILTPSIKPEAIEMNVKVVVLATPQLYHFLRNHDDDVPRIFKVWADFDASMMRDDAALQHVRRCMQGIVKDAGMLAFAPSAVGALLELGVRLAGRREKISIAFPQLRDIMEEANYMAMIRGQRGSHDVPEQEASETLVREQGSNGQVLEVTAQDVEAVLQARCHRAGQVEEKMQEMIDRGTILIDTKGLVVGQVNGLAVLSMGHHLFGKPTRITASTGMGKAGIVNIEREAELSGALHTKGILILTGYLNRMFAQKRPLVFSASIAFEQSYGGVDGDSASSTEVYALLSSLSGVPIKQGIAVTGSVNQKGEVQAIGGVNEKIEGFYDCCLRSGLTGEQGVIIPYANVQDLMLAERVVQATDRGDFHVWGVKNISEGIEILTGIAAGSMQALRNENGAQCVHSNDATYDLFSDGGVQCGYDRGETQCIYAKGSIFAKVDARLAEMSHAFYTGHVFSACQLE